MPEPSAGLTRLQRWVDAGGTLRVLERSVHEVTIALCTCDTGEIAERVTSTDPALLRLVESHRGVDVQ